MPRYTVSVRNYVSLSGSDPAVWGLDWTVTGPGQPAYYEVLRYQANGWSDFGGGYLLFGDYGGARRLGLASTALGQTFLLGAIPAGGAASDLAVTGRITIGQGDFLVMGGNGNDFWAGAYGANDEIYGLLGNDTLQGGRGDDLIDGGNGSDTLFGGLGNDTIIGGSRYDSDVDTSADTALYLGAISVRVNLSITGPQATGHGLDQLSQIEHLVSGAGHDRLIGDWKSNRLEGGAGNDTLVGNEGYDVLVGGLGADRMIGGSEGDQFWIDNAGDVVVELAGGGADRIFSTVRIDLARPDSAYANVEHVTLQGSGALSAYGSASANALIGNAGANVLAGRGGNDVLSGGQGSDTFVFGRAFDQDVIADFRDDIDQIRIQGIADVTNIVQARAHARQSGANVVFDFGNGDELTVRNITVNAVLDDLVFV